VCKALAAKQPQREDYFPVQGWGAKKGPGARTENKARRTKRRRREEELQWGGLKGPHYKVGPNFKKARGETPPKRRTFSFTLQG